MPSCPTCLRAFADSVTHCPDHGDTLVPDEVLAAIDRALAPGAMVGDFRIEGTLGAGGFGTVYRAVHPVIGKRAAVKVLSRALSSNPQMVSRFLSEARAVNQIRHPNIIDVFAFGALPDGRQYYVMELLEGSTFDALLRERGRLPIGEAYPILRAIARALDAAHGAGILHRDLKPENVFLTPDEEGRLRPKLLDFGIAKLTTGSDGHKTQTGAPMGTPYYMSPEQARGEEVDHRTDIYALGVMTFEVLAGRLPFDGGSAVQILMKHMTSPPPRVDALVPGLAASVGDAVARMMAKERADRPSSASEAVALLAPRPGDSIPERAVVRSASSGSGEREVPSKDLALAGTFQPAATEVEASAPARARLAAIGAIALACLAVGSALALSRGGRRDGERSSGGSAASALVSAASATPTERASAAPEPAPATVSLRVDVDAPRARLWLGERELGPARGTYEVDRVDAPARLRVSAPGFVDDVSDVELTADRALSVRLKRSVPAKGAPPIPKDLEAP